MYSMHLMYSISKDFVTEFDFQYLAKAFRPQMGLHSQLSLEMLCFQNPSTSMATNQKSSISKALGMADFPF